MTDGKDNTATAQALTTPSGSQPTVNFLDESEILKEHGSWNLVKYAGRCIALVSENGTEIKTLGCDYAEKENGTISDESELIDWLGREFLKLLSANTEPTRSRGSNADKI